MRFALTLCVAVLLSVGLQQHGIEAVDRSKFRTCAQTGFCSRHRRDGQAGPVDGVVASLVRGSVQVSEDGGVLMARVQVDATGPALALTVQAVSPGSLRVRLTESEEEDTGLDPRWEAPDVLVETALTPLEFDLANEIDPEASEGADAEALLLSFPTLDETLIARIQVSSVLLLLLLLLLFNYHLYVRAFFTSLIIDYLSNASNQMADPSKLLLERLTD
jgi:hypothetical protein